MELLIKFLPAFGVLGLIFVFVKNVWITKQEVGTPKMVNIAKHIADGAMSFLKAEYKILAIFVVAVIVADFAEKFIKAVVNKMGVSCANVLGIIVRWAVWIFAILAILSQLGVAREIIQILVSGFVALIVISAGIAFGLGGKDIAKETLEELKTKLKG